MPCAGLMSDSCTAARRHRSSAVRRVDPNTHAPALPRTGCPPGPCFRCGTDANGFPHGRLSRVMVSGLGVWEPGAIDRADEVSQRGEEPNARSQASFDRNEGDTARWSEPRAPRRACSSSWKHAGASSPRRWSSRRRPRRCCRSFHSSPGELEPVFEAMLANATRICEARYGTLFLARATASVPSRLHNAPPAYVEARTRETASAAAGHAARTVCQHEAACPDRRLQDVAVLHRARSSCRRRRRSRWLSHRGHRPDAQGKRADRRHLHLSPGSAPLHRQADRAGHEFRQPSRHRHREHTPAQRAARVAAAADRHRRRAQGDQPLDLRFADGAGYIGRIGGPTYATPR